MAGTHGVDVEFLHEHHVLHHLFLRYGTSVDCTEVVSVNTVELDSLAVDGKSSVGENADLSYTELVASDIDNLAVTLECDDEVL